MARSEYEKYVPADLRGIQSGESPMHFANGALSPVVPPRADWLSAVPASCLALPMRDAMQTSGYDPDL